MKKFLVLTLVLGMASLANAGLVITSDGTTELLEGESMTIGIASDADMTAFESHTWALVVNSEAASLSGGVPLAIDSLVNTIVGDVETNPTILNPDGTVGLWGGTLWTSMTGNLAPGDLYVEFMLTCNLAGTDAVVQLYEILEQTPFGEPLATLRIAQIPEPMTLALLGLGGLFLRRRK